MTEDRPDEPDVWAAGPHGTPPSPVRKARPLLFAVCVAGGAVATYFAIVATAGAWGLSQDDSDTAALARLVLLPALVVIAALSGALAVGLLVAAARQTRLLVGAGCGRLLVLWVLPLAAAAAGPLRALL